MFIMKEAEKWVRCARLIALAGSFLLALTGCISEYVPDPIHESSVYVPAKKEKETIFSKGSPAPLLIPLFVFLH